VVIRHLGVRRSDAYKYSVFIFFNAIKYDKKLHNTND